MSILDHRRSRSTSPGWVVFDRKRQEDVSWSVS